MLTMSATCFSFWETKFPRPYTGASPLDLTEARPLALALPLNGNF